MLQPQVAEVVAARDQKMVLGVMAGAEELAGLPHDPAVKLHDIRADLQGAGRFRDEIQERRRISSRIERDRPEVFAADQGAIDELAERDGLKRGVAAVRPGPARF